MNSSNDEDITPPTTPRSGSTSSIEEETSLPNVTPGRHIAIEGMLNPTDQEAPSPSRNAQQQNGRIAIEDLIHPNDQDAALSRAMSARQQQPRISRSWEGFVEEEHWYTMYLKLCLVGMSWSEIATASNDEFGRGRTISALQSDYYRLRGQWEMAGVRQTENVAQDREVVIERAKGLSPEFLQRIGFTTWLTWYRAVGHVP